MGPGFESLREHKTNAGLSQYIGDCSCSVQVGLTPSESIQLETMYMSKGQIWVGSIPPMAQSSLNLLYLRLTILGLHVPRLAELPCKEIVEGSIPFGSTKYNFQGCSL